MTIFVLVKRLLGNEIRSGEFRRRARNMFKRADLHRRRHRLVLRSRSRHRGLHPVMQGTAGCFSTVNTRETNWTLTEQERRGHKEEQAWKVVSVRRTRRVYKQLYFRNTLRQKTC